jgi:hypothetical protein
MLRLILSYFFVLIGAIFFGTDDADAQIKRRAVAEKRVVREFSDIFNPAFDLRAELDTLVVNPTDIYLYDRLEIAELRRLKDIAAPRSDLEEPEYAELRRVTERALSMQTARSVVRLLQSSDVRYEYEAFQRGLKRLNDSFRYSVQNNGERLVFSKANKGRKLVEFKLEFNLRHGAEPNMTIGDNFRLRYDMQHRGPVAEYAFNF